MSARSVASPKDQTVTFVELFFDLVFVFSVTQIVGLLHGGLTWQVVGEAVLVFWLVWWAWSQFTWSLNAADTTHPLVELGTLSATAVAFFMAVALPDAFHGRAFWFALTYVLVRALGLALYVWVASEHPTRRAAVRTWVIVSLGGLVAVLAGGLLGGTLQYWLWGAAILLDVAAAAIGGQLQGWDLFPEHFAERHGLFVIIALGETLIVAAGTVTGAVWNNELFAVAIIAVAITCALWWSYFIKAKPRLDRAFEAAEGRQQSTLARDAYSLLHFPMVCGVIAYAFVVEEVLAHPDEPLALASRLALAVGLTLFVGEMGAALWRATGRWPWPRLALTGVTAVVIIAVAGVSGVTTLGLALVGMTAVVLQEQRAGLGAGV